jgi:hypothetical protein
MENVRLRTQTRVPEAIVLPESKAYRPVRVKSVHLTRSTNCANITPV